MGFSFFSDLINPTKYDVPAAPQVDAGLEQKNAVQGNLATFDVAKELASKYNDFMAQQVSQRLATNQPYFAGLEKQIAGNYASQLGGQLSMSDAAASQRSSMGKALGLGIGGSPAGGALALRNLGLTQYGVQQQAQAGAAGFMGQMAQIKQAPMFDFSNVFLSPAQRIQTAQWNATNQWNVQNLQNQMKVQPDPWMKATAGLGDSVLTAAAAYYTMGASSMGGGGGSGGSGGGFNVGQAMQQRNMMSEYGGTSGFGSSFNGDINSQFNPFA